MRKRFELIVRQNENIYTQEISIYDHFDIMLVTVIFVINSLEKFQVIILNGYVD